MRSRFFQAKLNLLFDINVLLRGPDGSFDTSNAKELLTLSSQKGYNNISWELGNEPNSLSVMRLFELMGSINRSG